MESFKKFFVNMAIGAVFFVFWLLLVLSAYLRHISKARPKKRIFLILSIMGAAGELLIVYSFCVIFSRALIYLSLVSSFLAVVFLPSLIRMKNSGVM